jgi:nucleotide-binding universal stress UspA family protein
MIKTILVPATGDAFDAPTYTAAFAAARLFAAHVDALHVAADPLEVAVNAAVDGGAGGMLLESMIADMKVQIDDLERGARRIFDDTCAGEGVPIVGAPAETEGASASWHKEVGQESRWIVNRGMTADLIVAARGKSGADAGSRSTLEAALLETGRPLLIPGTSRAPVATDRIAIAWKPTVEAARAVAAALPFLVRAKAVGILIVEEDAARRNDADPLVEYLTWHGVRASVRRLASGAHRGPATLLTAADDGYGLLVMGGYGHARLREWIFGGFTARVLEDAPIPVLLAH